jgi:hypothetical protein
LHTNTHTWLKLEVNNYFHFPSASLSSFLPPESASLPL